MLEAFLIVSLLVWFPIIFYLMSQRGFSMLLAWLLIAPVVTNVLAGHTNPFFKAPEVESELSMNEARRPAGEGYAKAATSIRLQEVLEPTRILVSVLFGIFLLNALVKKGRSLPLDRTEIWMGLFSIILVLNVLLMSRRVAFGLKTAVDAFMIPFVAYYITRRYVTSEDRFRQLIKILGYIGIYTVIFCVVERLAHTEVVYRLHGPFAGAGQLFLVLTVIFYAILAGTQNFSHSPQRYLLYAIPVITLLTWSRGYWLGFLAGVGTFLFLGRRYISKSRKVGAIGVTLILLAFMAAGSLIVSDMVGQRVANTNTVEWRLARWQLTLEASNKQPLFGIGFNNLRDVFGATHGGYTTAHNSFLSLFAELGIVGLLAYLAIIFSMIWIGLRIYRTGAQTLDRWRGITVVSAIIAYQVAAATITILYTVELSQVYVYVFVGAVAGLYSRRHSYIPVARFQTSPQPMGADVPVFTR
jgi:O-antigen ligase